MAFQGKLARRGRAMRIWRRKQRAARATGARYYGDGGTIHATNTIDVEIHDGQVVGVWFRCQQLPFRQSDVTPERAAEMRRAFADIDRTRLTGVEVEERYNYDD